MNRMKSFKKKSAAQKFRKACNKRGFFASVKPQSGPRVKNPWVVFAARTCPGKGRFGPGR